MKENRRGCWFFIYLPLTSSSSTVVFESEDSLTWDSSPFLAIIDLPLVRRRPRWTLDDDGGGGGCHKEDRKREGTTINTPVQHADEEDNCDNGENMNKKTNGFRRLLWSCDNNTQEFSKTGVGEDILHVIYSD